MDSNKVLFSNQYYKDLVEKDLFEMMGFTNLSQEKRKELATAALETISERVIARILDKITAQDSQKFNEIVDTKNFNEAINFIKSKNIGVEKLFAEEMLIYKNEMIQGAELIKKSMVEAEKNKEE